MKMNKLITLSASPSQTIFEIDNHANSHQRGENFQITVIMSNS